MPEIPAAWLTVLISAGVSLIVTLGIEYLAKPRLEARKEQILERARLRRKVADSLNLAHSNYGMYSDLGRKGLSASSHKYRDFVANYRERWKREMGEQALEMVSVGRLLAEEDPLLFETLG